MHLYDDKRRMHLFRSNSFLLVGLYLIDDRFEFFAEAGEKAVSLRFHFGTG